MPPWARRPTSPFRLAATSMAALAAVAGTLGSPAAAEESRAIGDRYLDAMDTRHSASAIANMARGAGYDATAATDGRTADQAWSEALNSSLFAFFGHADAGILQVKDRAGVDNDEYLGAGTTGDVLPVYANYRFWSEFVPYVDVDDMRLAIFGGCKTAGSHETRGDLDEVAVARGVDAVVSFSKLVYFPSGCSSCVYSGNYFWDRFATHYGGGATLGVALSRARTDIVNKEGGAAGWGSYRIAGSVAAPGSVKLRPQGSGEPMTSQPLGTSPYTLGSLTVTETRSLPGGEIEQRTSEGVLLRRDSNGHVIDVWAPSAVEGPAVVTADTLRATSRTFVADVAGGSGWTLVAEAEDSHLDGEQLSRFTWRRDGSRPQIVDVEVDRRTGAVTYLGWAMAPDVAGGVPDVSASDAEQIALTHAGPGAETLDVEPVTWGRHLWLVRTRDDRERGPLGPQYQEVLVDAVTGELVRRSST